MNFLVHCWLGRDDPGLKAGGFLGDFVKGPLTDSLPPDLRRGLLLHRHLDVVSNRMNEMRSTYFRFGRELRRPAPILLDLVADHVLATRWSEFGEGSLAEFTSSCYAAISRYDIPSTARTIYAHMIETDLFARYRHRNTILAIMTRILKRLKFEHLTPQLARALDREARGFSADFDAYFPLLQQAASEFVKRHAQAPA